MGGCWGRDSDLLSALVYLLEEPAATPEDANLIIKSIPHAPHLDITLQWNNLADIQVGYCAPTPSPPNHTWRKLKENSSFIKHRSFARNLPQMCFRRQLCKSKASCCFLGPMQPPWRPPVRGSRYDPRWRALVDAALPSFFWLSLQPFLPSSCPARFTSKGQSRGNDAAFVMKAVLRTVSAWKASQSRALHCFYPAVV